MPHLFIAIYIPEAIRIEVANQNGHSRGTSDPTIARVITTSPAPNLR